LDIERNFKKIIHTFYSLIRTPYASYARKAKAMGCTGKTYVVIIGAGFAGLNAAKVLTRAPALPGVAEVALQQGIFIGRIIRSETSGKSRKEFPLRDKGNMVTTGRNKAIAQIGRLILTGYPAWLAWVFVHIHYLSDFRNRLFVLMQWGWSYFAKLRSMRIIIEGDWRFF